ncbi:MAG: hypothetical protein J6A89_07365 [Clostridia bacterium]|nr:hypothetical protein [Clostridia bacterium]
MNIKIYEEYQKAFAEVNYIIENSEDNIKTKIPQKFKQMIEHNMDNQYTIKFNLDEGLNNCKLLKKTKEILYFIYVVYICDDVEKRKFLKYEMEVQKNKKEKYDIEKIFKQRQNEMVENKLLPIKVKKENWYNKIKNVFKHIFFSK